MNIIEYCESQGKYSIIEKPFNLIDNICISELAYVPFDEFLGKGKSMSISELSEAFYASESAQSIINSKSFVSKAPKVLKAMANTERFGKCKVYNYVSVLRSENVEQFAAMMIDLPDHTTVVAFRGTDDSLIGWHEDLMILYTLMPSYKLAADYLNKYGRMFHKYRVLGHSKGGGLALFAAINAKFLIRHRIIQVISNDGPGLRAEDYKADAYNKIADRYIKIVPQYDLVGTIYDNAKNTIIVKSSNKELMQHDALSWQVLDDELDKADDLYEISKLYKEGINNFLNETTLEQRKMLVEEIFKYLREENINNLSDFANGGFSVVVKAMKALMELDPESKEVFNKIIKIFVVAKNTYINKKAQEIIVDKVKSIEKKIKK